MKKLNLMCWFLMLSGSCFASVDSAQVSSGSSNFSNISKVSPAAEKEFQTRTGQNLGRESRAENKIILHGQGVWSSSRGGLPSRAEDQTADERAALTMLTAEQLLMTIESYKRSEGVWPKNLADAIEKARMGRQPIIIGLGAWELGPNGSILAAVKEDDFCEALQREAMARSASFAGATTGCKPDQRGAGWQFFMNQAAE